MAVRFRQSFTLFPGVRVNVGKRGITTSIGVPGATVNIGRQGVRATVGAPGTGLSYSALVVPFNGTGTTQSPSSAGGQASQETEIPEGYTPANAKVYMPTEGMNEIASAATEALTSPSVVPLKDVLAKARSQMREIQQELTEARSLQSRSSREMQKRQKSIFRWFYRKSIETLGAEVPKVEAEIKRLEDWKTSTTIKVTFEASETAKSAYASLVRAFDTLRGCKKCWDVTSERSTNRVAERTAANSVVFRQAVDLGFSSTDIVQFDGKAMRFENVNGDDILIYPGVAVIPRADGAFALVDIRDIEAKFSVTRFQESEIVPSDTQVVSTTWEKSNRDGTRDKRFADNKEIPVCRYGTIQFSSGSGLREEYMFSNADATEAFVVALSAYQVLLSKEDAPSSEQVK